ncbi:MAG: phospho-N-acetylmuramoyl-pentapeptide-transferase [Planctomycetes bacterium]|nr:phospho-N-acetylmuramoyl-pentapeptide-transferase [Planctomycetota bacterium]
MLYYLLTKTSDQLDEIGLYSLLQVFYQLEFRAFVAVVCSFLIVLLFGRKTIRWLIKQKIGDSPEFYHADLNEIMARKAATPTMGGILICGSMLLTILLFADLTNRFVMLALIVLAWLAVLGGFDDWLKLTSARRAPGSREGLHAWEKLLFQIGIGAVAGYFLYRHGIGRETHHVLTLPFQRTYQPGTTQLESSVIVLSGVAFVLIATILIAGTSNAVNLTDGMDGLAPGTLAVASFALMVLCFIAGSFDTARFLMFPHIDGSKELMIVTGAMAGACLGFLWFNCAPAQVFMGDTGALPLGGLMAYIAVAIRQEILLLVIGGVFFMEMASVILQVGYFKWTGGKRIFRCSPIHHHFHLGGWSEPQVVTRFWVLAVVFAMIALVSIKLR